MQCVHGTCNVFALWHWPAANSSSVTTGSPQLVMPLLGRQCMAGGTSGFGSCRGFVVVHRQASASSMTSDSSLTSEPTKKS